MEAEGSSDLNRDSPPLSLRLAARWFSHKSPALANSLTARRTTLAPQCGSPTPGEPTGGSRNGSNLRATQPWLRQRALTISRFPRPDGVVEIWAESASGDVERSHFRVTDLDAFVVRRGIDFRIDGQAGFRRRATDETQDSAQSA